MTASFGGSWVTVTPSFRGSWASCPRPPVALWYPRTHCSTWSFWNFWAPWIFWGLLPPPPPGATESQQIGGICEDTSICWDSFSSWFHPAPLRLGLLGNTIPLLEPLRPLKFLTLQGIPSSVNPLQDCPPKSRRIPGVEGTRPPLIVILSFPDTTPPPPELLLGTACYMRSNKRTVDEWEVWVASRGLLGCG